MLAWFLRPFAARTVSCTYGACFGGWSLDALDVQIFSFVIPTLLAPGRSLPARRANPPPSHR